MEESVRELMKMRMVDVSYGFVQFPYQMGYTVKLLVITGPP
jgi:hypothetical protein